MNLNYKSRIEEFQRETKTSWRVIYKIVNAILLKNYNLLIRYAFENDNILPFEISELLGFKLNPTIDLQNRYTNEDIYKPFFRQLILLYRRENIVNYFIEKNYIQLNTDDVLNAALSLSLDWFKYILQLYETKVSEFTEYSRLFENLCKKDNWEIIRYIVETLHKLPNAQDMAYIAATCDIAFYNYFRRYGAAPYDRLYYATFIDSDLPELD